MTLMLKEKNIAEQQALSPASLYKNSLSLSFFYVYGICFYTTLVAEILKKYHKLNYWYILYYFASVATLN